MRSGRIGTVEHIVCHMEGPLRDLLAGEPMLETANDTYRPQPSTWADPARAGGYGNKITYKQNNQLVVTLRTAD